MLLQMALKHTTLRLTEGQLRKAKVETAKAGITLQVLLLRGLELALAELSGKRKAA
jgi:hypothetical protein